MLLDRDVCSTGVLQVLFCTSEIMSMANLFFSSALSLSFDFLFFNFSCDFEAERRLSVVPAKIPKYSEPPFQKSSEERERERLYR